MPSFYQFMRAEKGSGVQNSKLADVKDFKGRQLKVWFDFGGKEILEKLQLTVYLIGDEFIDYINTLYFNQSSEKVYVSTETQKNWIDKSF